MIFKNFEAESYLKLISEINEYAKEENLIIIDFSTTGNNALVLFKKK